MRYWQLNRYVFSCFLNTLTKCQANAVQPANYSKLWGHVQQSCGLRKLSWYVAQEVGRSWRIAGWTVQCVIRPV